MMNHFGQEFRSFSSDANMGRSRRSILVPPPSLNDALVYPESLSSYLSRAAENLFYSKNELIESFVVPRINFDYSLRFLNSGRDTYAINSTGRIAAEFERIYRQLFPRYSHYDFASFAFLSPLLGDKAKGVTSSRLKWCPLCIDRSINNHLDIRFPLYWHAKEASVCLDHKCYLQSQCPRCGSYQEVLVAGSQPGICQCCSNRLISSGITDCSITGREIWITSAINNLIRRRYWLSERDLLKNFKQFVSDIIEQSGGAKPAELKLGLSESLLRRWKSRNRPKFKQFLDVCFKLNIEPLDVLSGEVGKIDTECIKPCEQLSVGGSNKRSTAEIVDIQSQLLSYLSHQDNLSVHAIAREFGLSPGFLKYRFPEVSVFVARKANNKTTQDLRYRRAELYLKATLILVLAYRAGKDIGTHELRRILRPLPGFGHVSMPKIRGFLYCLAFNDDYRHFNEVFNGSSYENLLLNLMKRSKSNGHD